MRRYGGCIRRGGSVLDLACGRGRHAGYFLHRGHPVTAIDLDAARIRPLAEQLRAVSPSPGPLQIIEADLERDDWPFRDRRFDGIVVVNYLYRPHFPWLCDTLEAGGILLFDTFAVGNERYGRPSNPAHLLEDGELLRKFGQRLRILAYEYGHVAEPRLAVRERLCAMRTA